jgi:SAM-dependent methyltransferase
MHSPTEGRCVICGGSAGRPVFRKAGYEGRLCSCGAVYLSPPPDAVDPTVDVHPDSFYALPAAMKVRWLARSHPQGRLLEVGCGEGFFLAAAKAQGYEVAAIEPHPERARRVAERLSIEVECAMIENFQLPSLGYDVVYHCDLLSHFPDPDKALRRMKTLLRPNGVLFFEVGLHGEIAPYWYRSLSDNSFPQHRWLYSEEALRRLLHRCGLRIVRLKRFGLAPHVLIYQGASAILKWTGLLRYLRAASAPPSRVAASPTSRPQLTLEGLWHNFLRFQVGALVPAWGPKTLFVIAAPVSSTRT